MSDCVFCEKLYSDDVVRHPVYPVMSFVPLNPVVPGHLLFAPEAHVEHRVGKYAENAVSAAAAVAEQYALNQDVDFNLITSSGSAATQTIPHIHIHYVPRRDGDGLSLPWTGQVKS